MPRKRIHKGTSGRANVPGMSRKIRGAVRKASLMVMVKRNMRSPKHLSVRRRTTRRTIRTRLAESNPGHKMRRSLVKKKVTRRRRRRRRKQQQP